MRRAQTLQAHPVHDTWTGLSPAGPPQELAQLHTCMQVLMATNRIDILDPALLRPGRIDRKIEFPNPNDASRLDILKIHSRKMNLTRGIDLKKIAESMNGASGAELKGSCTEAGVPQPDCSAAFHPPCRLVLSPTPAPCLSIGHTSKAAHSHVHPWDARAPAESAGPCQSGRAVIKLNQWKISRYLRAPLTPQTREWYNSGGSRTLGSARSE
jgi:hypothetical protein